jgi:hypothetical protein
MAFCVCNYNIFLCGPDRRPWLVGMYVKLHRVTHNGQGQMSGLFGPDTVDKRCVRWAGMSSNASSQLTARPSQRAMWGAWWPMYTGHCCTGASFYILPTQRMCGESSAFCTRYAVLSRLWCFALKSDFARSIAPVYDAGSPPKRAGWMHGHRRLNTQWQCRRSVWLRACMRARACGGWVGVGMEVWVDGPCAVDAAG